MSTAMVSLFPKITKPIGGQQLPLAEVLAGIQQGRWRADVLAVRALGYGTDAYDEAKKLLPNYTPSGSFPVHRRVEGLGEHSGFVGVDLDAKDNPGTDWQAVRAAIEADPHTYACFTSVGGVGLFVLVPVPTTHHTASVRALLRYFHETFGVKPDESCKDVSRARFVSYDPALFQNPDAETFAEILEPAKPAAKQSHHSHAGPVEVGPSAEVEERLLAIGVNMIRAATDGTIHFKIRDASFTVGGYVGSGFVTESTAQAVLYAAVEARGDVNASYFRTAASTIASGLKKGALEPLLPDWLQLQVRKELRANAQSVGSVVEQAARIAATCHVPLAGVQDAVRLIAEEQREAVDLLTFWYLVPTSPKKDAPEKPQLSLEKFTAWLGAQGFRKYRQAGGSYATVRLVAGIVHEVDRGQLMDHVLGYLAELPFEFDGVYRFQVQELVLAGERKLFDEKFLQALPTLPGDWLRDTPTTGYYFFANCWVAVTGAGITPHDYNELPGQIWAEQVRAHSFTLLHDPNAALQADFHAFTVNVCGGYAGGGGQAAADRLALLRASLGYLLHGYKEEPNARCIIFVDEVATTGKPDGRTGKSLLIRAVGELVKVTTIAGATFRFEDSFRFQRISPSTRLAYFDEWDGRRLPFKKLFTEIVNEIAINRKNHAEFTIPFADSPKFAVTTNDVVSGEGGSHEARKIEIPLAPHYSAKHTPKDEFGVGFFREGWDAAEYNRFFNLALGWVQQFLAGGRQLQQLASAALDARKLEDSTSPEFLEWAQGELEQTAKAGGTLWAEETYKEFLAYSGESDRRLPMRRFYYWMSKLGYVRKRWKGLGTNRDKSYFEQPGSAAAE